MKRDAEHLNLLAIFHYVSAGLSAVGGLFPLLYVVIGVAMLNAPPPPNNNGPPPAAIGWFMIAFGAGFSLFLLSYATMTGMAGYFLHKRKARTFCFVVAALQCTQVPLGTLLGVFTIIVLIRPSVEDLFAGRVVEDDGEGRGRLDYGERDERFEGHPHGYYEPRREAREDP